MEISLTLYEKIVDFLLSLPNIQDGDSQRAFVYYAKLDRELQAQIPFGKPPLQFIPLLIAILLDYGRLKDGRSPVEAILEAAKRYIGLDKQEICDILIQEISRNRDTLILKKQKEKQAEIIVPKKVQSNQNSAIIHNNTAQSLNDHAIIEKISDDIELVIEGVPIQSDNSTINKLRNDFKCIIEGVSNQPNDIIVEKISDDLELIIEGIPESAMPNGFDFQTKLLLIKHGISIGDIFKGEALNYLRKAILRVGNSYYKLKYFVITQHTIKNLEIFDQAIAYISRNNHHYR